ncbi:ATP-binding cassette domain-containing protein, partial [Mesorhizobium sp. M7A.F.Ca.US.005.03.2.1]|uniref:ATP-binding cassette domain-containing protein n=1 Tax=Mesorhizobium sp. M7A.F.Ca.US.005.03.2.1 TaxID=2496737 RepID=UPI001FE161D7
MPPAAEAASPEPILLAVEGITKHFSGVTALSDVSLDIRPGEILGLLGENGAGKSTLLKILSGVMPPSSGHIIFDSADYHPSSPQDAKRLGILRAGGMIIGTVEDDMPAGWRHHT